MFAPAVREIISRRGQNDVMDSGFEVQSYWNLTRKSKIMLGKIRLAKYMFGHVRACSGMYEDV